MPVFRIELTDEQANDLCRIEEATGRDLAAVIAEAIEGEIWVMEQEEGIAGDNGHLAALGLLGGGEPGPTAEQVAQLAAEQDQATCGSGNDGTGAGLGSSAKP